MSKSSFSLLLILILGILSTPELLFAESAKVYPVDDAIAQLYDEDGIADWDLARNYQGDLFREPISIGSLDNTGNIYVRSDKGVGTYRIYRSSNVYDLSAIPEGMRIKSASLHLFRTVANNRGDINVVVTSHQRGDITQMSKADWRIQNFGTKEFARGPLNFEGYNTFAFNEDGLEYLNSHLGGLATMGILTEFDFDDIEPTGFILSAGWHEVEMEGKDFDPYIQLELESVNKYPLYTQIPSPYPSREETEEWADDLMPCGTIAQCGCTISSMVMLSRASGIDVGIDGSSVNPANFNEWLKANGGYDATGNLRFERAIEYFGVLENGVPKSYFRWSKDRLPANSVRDRLLNAPVVAEMRAQNRNGGDEFTHFVLLTNRDGDRVFVNDPLWFNTIDLLDVRGRDSFVQSYDDRIVSGRNLEFSEEPVDLPVSVSATLYSNQLFEESGVVSLVARSAKSEGDSLWAPGVLLMTSAGGNKLGLDPRDSAIFEQSKGYHGTSAPLLLYGVEDQQYYEKYEAGWGYLLDDYVDIDVIGTDAGEYLLDLSGRSRDGLFHTYVIVDTTMSGLLRRYRFSLIDGSLEKVLYDAKMVNDIVEVEIPDEIDNAFFKKWVEKIFAEVANEKYAQASQHIDTLRTLLRAKKYNSELILYVLDELESQVDILEQQAR